MSVSIDTFKEAMSRFASGVTVVTTREGDTVHGFTASAFCSVSLEPPLVLVCVARTIRSHDMMARSGIFAVNILNANQRHLGERFAGLVPDVQDRFADLAYETATTGSPILPDVLAWLDCRVWASYDGGDHTIFVGEVVDAGVNEMRPPLLYFHRQWAQIGPSERGAVESWPEGKEKSSKT